MGEEFIAAYNMVHGVNSGVSLEEIMSRVPRLYWSNFASAGTTIGLHYTPAKTEEHLHVPTSATFHEVMDGAEVSMAHHVGGLGGIKQARPEPNGTVSSGK